MKTVKNISIMMFLEKRKNEGKFAYLN